MNRTMPGVFGLGVSVLPACGIYVKDLVIDSNDLIPAGAPDAFDVQVSWADDGGLASEGSCGDTLKIRIHDPLGAPAWDLGLLSADWAGEDCLNGQAGYALCHPIGVDHLLQQVPDCLTSSVVPGSTTRMEAPGSWPYLTYYRANTSSCFIWGVDVAYYAALGCEER